MNLPTDTQVAAERIDRDPWWQTHDEETGECLSDPCPRCD